MTDGEEATWRVLRAFCDEWMRADAVFFPGWKFDD